MLRRSKRLFRCAVVLFPLALAASALLSGCDEPAGSGAASGAKGGAAGKIDETQPPNETYVVRGVVRQLPVAGQPQTEFKVKHEAIDNYVNRFGEVVGMGAMTMDFPRANGVSLDGLAVGDVVELTFAVWRKDGRVSYKTTAIRKLAGDTKLEFREARPPAKAPAKDEEGAGTGGAQPPGK
jgi:Cu/Ag efflux protein CusF